MSVADIEVSSRPTARRLCGARLLLAEDSADHRHLFAATLRRAGAEVDLAENGRLAVERVLETDRQGQPYDLVIMDMQMPELDGYSAASTLRRAGHDGAILALTAHAMSGMREKCLQAGCSAYASKPIRGHQLVETVGELLHSPRRALAASAA